ADPGDEGHALLEAPSHQAGPRGLGARARARSQQRDGRPGARAAQPGRRVDMHVLAGILITLAAFWLSKWAQGNLPYFGLFNPAALVLLVVGPLGVSLVSHQFKEWRSNLVVLLRAFRSDQQENLYHASDEMMQLARALRETRWAEAESAVARSRSEQVKLLAPHLLQRLEPDALREAIASSAFRWMSEVRLADEFFQSLARLSPAFGMIGTIMGLVDLFGHMRDSASLGPGMAVALLA